MVTFPSLPLNFADAAIVGHPGSIIGAHISKIIYRKYSGLCFFNTAFACFGTINGNGSSAAFAHAITIIFEIIYDRMLAGF